MKIKISVIGLALTMLTLGLYVPQINAENNKDPKPSIQNMEYENFLELVKARRSVRKFKPDPIPDGDIKKIVEAARWAPSGFNSQLWEFVVVKKPELRKRIAEIIAGGFGETMKSTAPAGGTAASEGMAQPTASVGGAASTIPSGSNMMAFANAPVFILLLGDTRVRPYGPPFDDQRWLSVYLPSLAIAYQHMALAATSLDLGSQWVSTINQPGVPEQVRSLLGIPKEMVFFDMFVVGYPDMEPTEKKMRPLEEMLHFDDCGINDFRTEEQVKAYFEKK
jgi:nitroreductase